MDGLVEKRRVRRYFLNQLNPGFAIVIMRLTKKNMLNEPTKSLQLIKIVKIAESGHERTRQARPVDDSVDSEDRNQDRGHESLTRAREESRTARIL